MARGAIEKLTVGALRTKEAGLISDGGNLYLRTFKAKDGSLTRSWIFRFRLRGSKRERDMGIGSLNSIGLAKAREIAGQARELVAQGIDPIENHRETIAIRRVTESKKSAVPTFDQCRDDILLHTAQAGKTPSTASNGKTR